MRNCCNIWRNTFQPLQHIHLWISFFKSITAKQACVLVKELFFLIILFFFLILSFWVYVICGDGKHVYEFMLCCYVMGDISKGLNIKHDFLFLHETQHLTFFEAISSGNWTTPMLLVHTIILVFFIKCKNTLHILILLSVQCWLHAFLFMFMYVCVCFFIFRILMWAFFSNHWYAMLVLLYFMNS